MATADAALNAARSYLGEGPQRFWDWYPAPAGTAWCCIFQSYVLTQVGIPTHYAWVSGLFDFYRSQGRTYAPHEAQPGDLVAFDYDGTGPSSYDHIAMVESVNDQGIVAINGNWENKVQRVLHRWNSGGFAGGIAEIARPAYLAPTPTTKGSHEMRTLLTMTNGCGVEFCAVFGTLAHRWQTAPGSIWTDWAPVVATAPPVPVDSVTARQGHAGALEVIVWNAETGQAFRSWQTAPGSAWVDWQAA